MRAPRPGAARTPKLRIPVPLLSERGSPTEERGKSFSLSAFHLGSGEEEGQAGAWGFLGTLLGQQASGLRGQIWRGKGEPMLLPEDPD